MDREGPRLGAFPLDDLLLRKYKYSVAGQALWDIQAPCQVTTRERSRLDSSLATDAHGLAGSSYLRRHPNELRENSLKRGASLARALKSSPSYRTNIPSSISEEAIMRYCHTFSDEKPGLSYGIKNVMDGTQLVVSSIATHITPLGTEIRDMGKTGVGLYTDNGRYIDFSFTPPFARAVDLHTVFPADIEFFDENGGSIFTVTLPDGPSGATYQVPGRRIARLTMTAKAEFLVLELCVDMSD